MRVAHVRIANILGIGELEFSPGAWTEISGGNGAGKTSVLSALRSALSGGQDATLLRHGAERGEVCLLLDDGLQIRKRVTPSGTTVTVERDGSPVKKPASVIAQLADALSVNPVEFLRAPDKQRVDVLLATMPVHVDRSRLIEITGACPTLGADGLDLLDAARRAVYDERTGTNRELKSKEATIAQLRATLPVELPPEPPSDAELMQQLNDADAARDAELARIDAKLEQVGHAHAVKMAGLQAQVDALRTEMLQADTAYHATVARAQQSRQMARVDHQNARADAERALAGITAAREARARFAQTAETITTLEGDAAELSQRSVQCTTALDALDDYRSELLRTLPIPGLEVRDGSIYRDGIAFDRLNTAQQVGIAVEIAKLRAGPLGLICVDGLELLDPAAYEAFRASAEASGLQLVVSRVTDGPLAVEAAA